LTFSTLFPNREQPNHGIFVENRLRHLVNGGEVDSVVVAPIPYFPSGAPCLGEWSRYARIERQERRHGIAVHHPRFPVVPRIGMTISPLLLAAAMFAPVRRLYQAGAGFELIDAHYFFPDGVAALLLGRRLGCPVVVTARGSDINLIPGHPVPRAMIRWAIREADGLIAVSSALKEALVELGADPEAIEVLRNGVDPETFRPVGRDATRRDLGLTRSTLLSVGHLIERKGHDRVIAAMPELADFELLIVGDGPQRERLEALRHQFGVADRVRLLGAKPHDALPAIYSAADALVLASSREGWANVLLEAMACGTPVIASAVWGNPEVVCAPEAGILMDENTPQGIARAARALFANLPTRAATRIFAERFGWDETSRGQLALFRRVLQRQTEVAVA
jgi:glycosyltransferase involved in cell wall biosynthesis